MPARRAGSSTFDGRCSVTSRYSPSDTPCVVQAARLRAAALEAPQRVDHRVAHVADAAGVDALARQVLLGLGAVREQDVGEAVGEDAVDLLGHVPVARAQPGLEVGDRDVSFAAASAQASVELTSPATTTSAGRSSSRMLLEGDQDLAGLLAVAAGADAQRVVGGREAEILEDLLRHPAVVVLAGVDDHLARGAAPAQRLDQRGHLHEVRAGRRRRARRSPGRRWVRGAAARGGVERSRQINGPASRHRTRFPDLRPGMPARRTTSWIEHPSSSARSRTRR